ncbi:sarcosine oxidase subunit gamma [Halodurantibacterium flavum]|uniref:Sarcosine oxidase subunit gamma n=1 Tax=Halodurantibacterium flavum TaxID=1382802 RepID=A0ABW4S546_9RHOB
MSDLAMTSGASGAIFRGIATVEELSDRGMILLRAPLADPATSTAVRAAIGLAVPDQRGLLHDGDRAVGWMSPDELLLVLPHAGVAATLAALKDGLAGSHHLVQDVSDMRAVFRISGPHAREVLAKLAPVDMGRFGPGELRRTRAAQVPAAFWMEDDGAITLVCFRSVGRYMFDLLCAAATPGSEVGVF